MGWFDTIKELFNRTRFLNEDEVKAFREIFVDPSIDRTMASKLYDTLFGYMYKHKRLKYILIGFLALEAFAELLLSRYFPLG